MISIEQARELILSECEPLPAERLPLSAAVGRVLCSPAIADVDIPPFDNSAMDGYAVRASDTAGASAGSPVRLQVVDTIAAGMVGEVEVIGVCSQDQNGAPCPGRKRGWSGGPHRANRGTVEGRNRRTAGNVRTQRRRLLCRPRWF